MQYKLNRGSPLDIVELVSESELSSDAASELPSSATSAMRVLAPGGFQAAEHCVHKDNVSSPAASSFFCWWKAINKNLQSSFLKHRSSFVKRSFGKRV